MFVDNETMAIKSAGCIFAFTYFFAESTARSICSTSIAEKSKNNRIKRRSRASIVASCVTAGGAGDGCAGVCCARLADGSSSIKATALAIARILRANIQLLSLKPETCDKCDAPHGRGGGHFAKGQRVYGRIQAGELHRVKNIVGLNSQIQ